MKTCLTIGLAALMMVATVPFAGAQGNPLRITCPPNQTNWICDLASTAAVRYPDPTTAGGNCTSPTSVTCSPASGAPFILGTTTVTCRATNSCRESDVCSFTVTVARDTTPPVIQCPGNVTVQVCGTASSVPVTFAMPTATDNADTNVPVTCSPPSGALFQIGTTTVTCTAVDDCNNRTTCTFTITVARDTAPPIIQCPSNMVLLACDRSGAVVNYPAPTATDNLDLSPAISCVPPSGSLFPTGTTTVTCTATDDCNNRSTCTFVVTVRPLLYGGLCHSPLGRASLQVNTNDELEVSGFGTNGQDGVRIELGESQGLRWQMKLPTNADGEVDGRDFLIWRRDYGRTLAGTEIQINEVLFAFHEGRGKMTPSAASYEFKLLLDGKVVYREGGRTGAIDLPVCTPVWTGHCWEGPSIGDHPFLPHCMWLLGQVCDVETPGGPVRADTLVVTPEDPLPQITSISAIEVVGRDLPMLTLRQERLMMFGSLEQSPQPHRALGQARLVAENGMLTMADLGASGEDGVRIDLEQSRGLLWRMKRPPGTPEGDMDVEVFGRSPAGTEIPLRRISHHYRDGRHSITPGAGPYELKLLLGGQVVFQQGGQTGEVDIPECHHVEDEQCVGEPFAGLSPFLPYCFNVLTIECDWETPNGPVRADTLVLTPEDPLPPFTAVSAVQILARNVQNLPSLTLIAERVLPFPGSELRLACPTNLTVQTCSTNPVPVTFPPPAVTGGNCSSAASVVCVPPSGSLFPAGTTLVVCTATNACGQRAVCSFPVEIRRDTTPPSIHCPTDVNALTANPTGRAVYYGPLVTTDDPAATINCTPPSGSVFPVGTTTVVCTARDACGNQQTCTFTIEVTLLKLLVGFGASGPFLSWTGDAILETSDEVSGPWLAVRGATSPFLMAFVGPKKFFRLSAPVEDVDCGEIVLNPSAWNINVPSARIQGAFLLDGQAFPVSFLQGANFFLRNPVTGDEVYLGLSNNQFFDRRVVPGRYDVVYEHKIGRDLPLNSHAIVIEGLMIAGNQEFDIDVPSVSIRGSFTLAGAPFPVTATESALIQARDQQTGTLTALGETADQTYSALLIPGTYDLMYSRIAGSEIVPANKLTAFRRDVSLVASGALDLDVLVVSISGQFTINGAPAPMSPLESGWIFLLDPETDAETLIGQTSDQIYRVLLIPGRYDLKYDRIAGADIAPANSSARFLTGVPFAENSTHDIDVPSVQISGNFRVKGAPAPATALENARIRLRQGEDVVNLGETRVGQFLVRVIPGTYDVAFEGLTAGDIMPANGDAVLGAIEIAGASEFDIDIPAIDFSAELRFNGGNFPGPGAGELARLYLEDTRTADLIYLGDYPASEQAHRLVIPGTYRVRYEYGSGGELPRNPFAVLGEDRTLTQSLSTVINIQAVSLAGTFSLDGGAFPPGAGENAAIVLQSLTSVEDALHLGGTAGGGYATVLLPGRYAAFYDWAQGDSIPRNQKARLDCPDPR